MPDDDFEDCGRNIHVVPLNDLRPHDVENPCWCVPTHNLDEPCVLIHHAMDRREEHENGRLKH